MTQISLLIEVTALARWCGPVVALSAMAIACGPADRSGTVQARLVAWNEASQRYEPQLVVVDHLESLRALRGRDLELRAFSTVGENELAGRSGSSPKLKIDTGKPFSFQWVEGADGEVFPADESSMAALALYRHIDLAISEYRAHGWEPSSRLSVLVNPRWDNLWLGDQRYLHTDNAAIGISGAQAFYVALPVAVTPGVPLTMNLGVTGHEIGHWAMADLTGVSRLGRSSELQAVSEGISDLFGFALVGDPNFLAQSLDVDRNLAEPRDYQPEQYLALQRDASRDVHSDGSVLARAIYELWPRQAGTYTRAEREALLREVISALKALDSQRPPMPQLCGRLVAQLPPAHRGAACQVLRQRAAPFFENIQECQ